MTPEAVCRSGWPESPGASFPDHRFGVHSHTCVRCGARQVPLHEDARIVMRKAIADALIVRGYVFSLDPQTAPWIPESVTVRESRSQFRGGGRVY